MLSYLSIIDKYDILVNDKPAQVQTALELDCNRGFSSGKNTNYTIITLLEKFVEVGMIERDVYQFRVFSCSWAYDLNGYIQIGSNSYDLAGIRFVFMGLYQKDPTIEEENNNNFDLLMFCSPAGMKNGNGEILKYSARSGSQYKPCWMKINTTKVT